MNAISLREMSARDVFISYGREEGVKEFARGLYNDLRASGLTVWLDVEDIPIGSDWPKEIGLALKHCKALIAIMTKKYVCESDYCKKELYSAIEEKKRVYPVVYEDSSSWAGSNEGAGVRYMICGLNWAMFRPNEDNYATSLGGLVEALKCVTTGDDDVDVGVERKCDNLKLRVTSPHVEKLLSILVEAAGNWVLFLGQLQLPRGKVDQINRDIPNTDNHSPECLRAGLYFWASSDENPTYESLCDALRTEIVGQNVLAEKVELYAAGLNVTEENKSTFSVAMTYDDMYQWLLKNGLDEEDCQLLKDKKVNGKVFSKLKLEQLEKLGVSFGALVLLGELLEKVLFGEYCIEGNLHRIHYTQRQVSLTIGNQLATLTLPGSCHTRTPFPDIAASDPKPSMTLLQLLKWKSSLDGSLVRLRVMRDSSPVWESLGTALALSPAELAGFKKKHMEDPDDCIREVFSRWLSNGGQMANADSYPVSWKGLYNLLCDCELQELAKQLCEALQAPRSTFRKNL